MAVLAKVLPKLQNFSQNGIKPFYGEIKRKSVLATLMRPHKGCQNGVSIVIKHKRKACVGETFCEKMQKVCQRRRRHIEGTKKEDIPPHTKP